MISRSNLPGSLHGQIVASLRGVLQGDDRSGGLSPVASEGGLCRDGSSASCDSSDTDDFSRSATTGTQRHPWALSQGNMQSSSVNRIQTELFRTTMTSISEGFVREVPSSELSGSRVSLATSPQRRLPSDSSEETAALASRQSGLARTKSEPLPPQVVRNSLTKRIRRLSMKVMVNFGLSPSKVEQDVSLSPSKVEKGDARATGARSI